jgi:predicted GTPase
MIFDSQDVNDETLDLEQTLQEAFDEGSGEMVEISAVFATGLNDLMKDSSEIATSAERICWK